MNRQQIVRRLFIAAAFYLPFSASTFAATHTETHPFAVKLTASRVIYDPARTGGVSLGVSNKQDYPILVQSVVMDASRKKHGSFIITPPLFRLDAGQESRLRIIGTGGNYPKDRESLNWICVKGIPPKGDDLWAGDAKKNNTRDVNLNIEVSVNSCIKLLIRPASVIGGVESAARHVTWKLQGNHLIAHNPTPYYINVSSVRMGQTTASGENYIAPFSDGIYAVNGKTISGDVNWKLVTDYGSEQDMKSVAAR
ncbi:fimbria/pilus periplasmic chaperone [Salmonella enterica]|nr:fimbria/pilus periplasmic chaperone [Salmonella enterica]ECJ3906547.1 pilus assembly protein [Salmonella enterica subsp. enterica serovar Poona]EDU8777377.1 fimbria/pilus periplasmic chaperone [Salmonella enterica subsp. enterica serovar Poona]EJO2225690.1 fimbria/pilus periplasmic chaperone [Salmonella enterica]